MSGEQHVILTERTRFGDETAAGTLRNQCAFTSRDMAADWPEAITYAIVAGWDDDPDCLEPGEEPNGAWRELAEKYGWDDTLIAFLRDTHERFKALPDKVAPDEP